MRGLILFAESESLAAAAGFAVLCVSMAAYYITVEWRKARQTQIEVDLKREMVQKGLPADDIERILKASAPREE